MPETIVQIRSQLAIPSQVHERFLFQDEIRRMRQAIEKAAQDIPIVISPNFSMGIALCLKLAAMLGNSSFSTSAIEIFETHHAHKKDQPSGTALALALAIGAENIVIHSERSGETVGEHLLVFENGSELIEIKHTAQASQRRDTAQTIHNVEVDLSAAYHLQDGIRRRLVDIRSNQRIGAVVLRADVRPGE